MERYPALDLLVRGEADTRFADLLEGLADGRGPADFPGVTFRENGGGIAGTADAAQPEDLDALPFPARHLLPMERYIGPDGGRFTTLVGTRGCPGRCLYCSVHQAFGGALRCRDPVSVAEEMDACASRFHTRVFGFTDDTFTANREWVLKLCEAFVSRGLHRRVRWFCLTRVDRVDPDLLRAMRRAGCFKVEFGIESGDQEVLDYLGKGITPDQVLQAFRWARQAGLKTMAFVMLFSPAETRASLQRTKRLVFAARPDLLQASFCTPYPGTRLAEECRKAGIHVSEDWSRFVFLTGPVIDHPRFSREEMLAEQRRLLRGFYFHPRTVLRLGRYAFASGAWKGFLRTVLSAVRSLAGTRTG